MAAAPAQRYHYLHASALRATATGPQLALASSTADAHPHFFSGRFLQPRLVAELLSTVQRTVAARFYTPANTLAKAIALADPIVTAGAGLLRFEGFSACGSSHVRVDLLPSAYAGDVLGSGCTNVDFNAPMRAALARVREDEPLFCEVGRSELALRSAAGECIEKKVPLPTRWLRGLLEVQAYQARMGRRLEVSGPQALRFFRSLPKASTARTPLWIGAGPQGLSLGATAREAAVRCADVRRLRLLEALLARAQALRLYADAAQQASAWELDFGSARITLTLSAETWRGFSGEGQALRALIRTDDAAALAAVRAQLHWQAELDAAALAERLQLAPTRVDTALQRLATSGLVGFDLHTGRYFHRELPLQRDWIADFHPRLQAARELLAQQAVARPPERPDHAEVRSAGALYSLRRQHGHWRCSCPWFAKHQGERGPCKHVLALEAFEDSQDPM